MKRFLIFIGRPAFWLTLPLLWIYLGNSRRTRVLIMAEGKALVVKSWYGSGKWNLSGGGLHNHEEVVAGALREVWEETGLRLQPPQLRPLGPTIYRKYGIMFHYERFYVTLPETPAIQPQQQEIVATAWIPLENLLAANTDEDVRNTYRAWTNE